MYTYVRYQSNGWHCRWKEKSTLICILKYIYIEPNVSCRPWVVLVVLIVVAVVLIVGRRCCTYI